MRLSSRLTIAMVALVLLTALAVSLLAYRNIVAIAVPRALQAIDSHTRAIATLLDSALQGARSDVIGFRSAVAARDIMMATLDSATDPSAAASEAEQKKRLAERFVAELKAKPQYSQFRLIGVADGGRELVRVERTTAGGTVHIVPDDELQQVGEEDYFRQTVTLPPDGVYVSPVDLNKENGAIELPYTPTLRTAAPIYTPDGRPFGIVVINVDLRPAFARIRQDTRGESKVFVVNEQGDYLVNPDPTREFGFEFGKPIRVQDDFPQIAQLFDQGNTQPVVISDRDGEEFGIGWQALRLAGGPRVRILETVPYSQLMAPVYAIFSSSLLAGLVAILCAALCAVVLARSLTRPLVQMTEAVEGFSRGENLPMPQSGGPELKLLSAAFTRMLEDARQKTAALWQEIEERRRVFDTSPDLILVTDSRGRFTRVNPASEPILGYRPEEMVGRAAIEFILPDDLDPTRAEMRAARRGRVLRNFETRYLHKDGRVVLLAWSGVWSEPTHQYFFVGRDMTEQKLAEDKLRLAVEASPGALVMIDNNGAIALVNAETERMFGYKREELIGQSVDILVPKPLRGLHLQHRRDFTAKPLARRMGERDLYGLRKDGSEFPVEIGLNPIQTPAGLLVMSVIVDVTESKKAEIALKLEVEERKHVAEVLRNTISSIVDPVLVADEKGKVLLVNPPAERIFGKLVGVDTDKYQLNYERFYPDNVTPFPFEKTALHRAVRGETVDDLELIIRQKGSASGRHLISTGRPIRSEAGVLQGAVTIYRDVTEAKRAEQALRDSEQMARGIIETALDAFVQLDETGTIVDWSPKAEAMFGWSRHEVAGQKLRDTIVPEASRAAHSERMAQFLHDAEKGLVGRRYEAPFLRRDGRELMTEISLTALRRASGYIINGFLRDITEKLAAEEQLRQAQKMESVGQLTGGIAHDFNNMLTAITGTIDILAEAVADKPEMVAIAKLISDAADRGAELTGHLLAFARKQPLQPRETDIYELLVETTKLLRPTLGEQIEIETNLHADIWPALIDPGQLSNALLNLAVNARDAMPDGGKLMIEADNKKIDETAAEAIGDIQPGHYVLIAISDTGSGIPPEIRDKVFEPFFTTKDVGKGTGLGLSMVYGFVKQSGGHIKVYSEVGHGTTFRIYLPQAADMPAEQREEASSTIEGGNETILIVEDDPLVRGSVTTQLQGLGYHTLSASNAAEAIAICDGGAEFDLLFTDVIMPGKMNGPQLAQEIAKRRSPLRVLFTSGYTEDALIHHGRLDAGVLLLTKPYRKQDLARMLRIALGSEGLRQAVPPAAQAG